MSYFSVERTYQDSSETAIFTAGHLRLSMDRYDTKFLTEQDI